MLGVAKESGFRWAWLVLLLVCCRYGGAETGTSCLSSCGDKVIKYPFGVNPGCGHPAFQGLLQCTAAGLNLSVASGSYSVQSLNYSNRTIVVTDSFFTNKQGCFKDMSHRKFSMSSSGPLRLLDTLFLFTACDRSKGAFLTPARNYACNFSSDACAAYERCGSGNPAHPASLPACCTHAAEPVDWINLQALNCSSAGSNMGYTALVGDVGNWLHGFQMQWSSAQSRTQACDACSASGGICGYNQSDKSFLCICTDPSSCTPRIQPSPSPSVAVSFSVEDSGSGRRKKLVAIVLVSLGVVAAALAGVATWWWYGNKRRGRRSSNKKMMKGTLEGFTLDDVVMEATMRFTHDKE